MNARNFLAATMVTMVVAAPALAQDEISRTISVNGPAEVSLANVSGNIVVTAGDRDSILIEATKRGGSQEARDAVTVEIEERGDRIAVRTRYPRQGGERNRGRVSVDIVVEVPGDTEVSANSVSGDISVEGADGETRVETVSGDVEVSAAGDLSRTKSVSGDIVIRDSSGSRELEASSVSGSVDARQIRARRLDMSTVSGRVTLVGVETERADIKSVSGGIEFVGTLAPDGQYERQSHSGSIELQIPDTVGFELEASSFSGTIRSDLTIETNGAGGDNRRTLEGRFGDGSAFLDLTSFSGNISITRQ